jgi:tetratricopeptide (TPR) repeat protein
VQANKSRRYYQALTAYNQAILANPEEPVLHLNLGDLYLGHNRGDLALREYTAYLEIVGPPDEENEAAKNHHEQMLSIKKDLEAQIEAFQRDVNKAIENKEPKRNWIGRALERGYVLMALDLAKEEGELPEGDPFILMLQLEAGAVQTAYEGLVKLEGQLEAQTKNARIKQFGLPPNFQLRHTIALAAFCVGDYDKAIEQWVKQANETEQGLMLARLGTLPMVNRPIDPIPLFTQSTPLFMRVGEEWPYVGWTTEGMFAGPMAMTMANSLWNAALCEIEVGRPVNAAQLLERMLELYPETSYRPLALFYIELIHDEPTEIDLYPPSQFIPVWEGMFAPGPAVAEKPARKETETPEQPKK